MFPGGMGKAFPALEEMTLLMLPPYARHGIYADAQNDRPAKVIPSLKTLNVSLSFGDVPTDDPDFRVWLAARIAAPDLTVNGRPADAGFDGWPE